MSYTPESASTFLSEFISVYTPHSVAAVEGTSASCFPLWLTYGSYWLLYSLHWVTWLKFLLSSNSFVIDSSGLPRHINIPSASHLSASSFLICFSGVAPWALPVRHVVLGRMLTSLSHFWCLSDVPPKVQCKGLLNRKAVFCLVLNAYFNQSYISNFIKCLFSIYSEALNFSPINGILCIKRFLNIKVILEIKCPLSVNPQSGFKKLVLNQLIVTII